MIKCIVLWGSSCCNISVLMEGYIHASILLCQTSLQVNYSLVFLLCKLLTNLFFHTSPTLLSFILNIKCLLFSFLLLLFYLHLYISIFSLILPYNLSLIFFFYIIWYLNVYNFISYSNKKKMLNDFVICPFLFAQ